MPKPGAKVVALGAEVVVGLGYEFETIECWVKEVVAMGLSWVVVVAMGERWVAVGMLREAWVMMEVGRIMMEAGKVMVAM